MVMGDLVRDVDVVVIGGGPGGYSAAFRCAELGLETVVVDVGKRLGGACLFEGCIPSKALLHVAAVLGEAERAKEFGVDFGPARVSLDPLRKWKSERVIGKLSRGLASVAKAKGVEVVGGRGVFEDARTVRVEAREGGLFDAPTSERVEQRRGSAQIAIDVDPKFDRLVFMDTKPTYCAALRDLADRQITHSWCSSRLT